MSCYFASRKTIALVLLLVLKLPYLQSTMSMFNSCIFHAFYSIGGKDKKIGGAKKFILLINFIYTVENG